MGAALATANAQQGEVAGMSSERLARIAPAMREQVDKSIFPGAVTLVARRGEVVHDEAHGFLDAAKTRPMTKNAIFRLASVTKPIVTVAGMMLVEVALPGRSVRPICQRSLKLNSLGDKRCWAQF